MSGAVFLSRILGLVREQVFAYFFGAGMATDAYLVAYRIPNLLRDLLAEGAMSSAFVTVFSREKDEKKARETAVNVATALSIILGIICVLTYLYSDYLVTLLAPDFSLIAGKHELTNQLTKIYSPFLFFVAFAALSMGILNTKGYFFWPSMGPAAYNLGCIVLGSIGAYYYREEGIHAMIVAFTVSSVLGGILQWGVQWPLLKKLGYSPLEFFKNFFSLKKLQKVFADPALVKIVKLMAPAILTIAVMQFYNLINTILASGLAEGSVSWINYAYRLVHFPLGVFGVALSAASLPSFAKLIHENRIDEFNITFKKSLRLTWILAIGSTAGLIAFREPLTSLMFERGLFTREDTLQCALALAAYALSIPFINTNKLLTQVFYAKDKVYIPTIASVFFVASHYFVASWAAQNYGHVGIAAATSFTSLLNTLILSGVLIYWKIPLMDKESLRIVIAATFGALFILLFEYFGLSRYLLSLRTHSSTEFLVYTLLSIAFVGIGYLAITAIPSKEFRELLKRLKSKRK